MMLYNIYEYDTYNSIRWDISNTINSHMMIINSHMNQFQPYEGTNIFLYHGICRRYVSNNMILKDLSEMGAMTPTIIARAWKFPFKFSWHFNGNIVHHVGKAIINPY